MSRRAGFLIAAARFVWRYAATAALVGALAAAMIRVAAVGTGPVPQGPPNGYSVASGRVSLEWNKGTRKEPFKVQVSVEDPSFAEPIVDKAVSGTSYALPNLLPGKKYYWRLVQGDEASPTSSFEVPMSHVEL
jgi:hypothetical protein